MNKKRLLIAGDSFAADWRKKYKDVCGWVNMLETDFDVTNIAEAGVSEYKIYKQLEHIDTKQFDHIIISHTSAYRIPIEEHPIHKEDVLHGNCDLIFSDIQEHLENPTMKIAYDFYSKLFYTDYFIFVNDLIFNQIQKLCPNALHITFFDSFYKRNILKCEKVFLNCKGNVNHLNEKGNIKIYKKLKKKLYNAQN